MSSKLSGTGVALATPMNKDLSVDFEALASLVEHTIAGGVDYLVVLGTTGESPVFSWSEKREILDFIIEKNKGRKPIVFGLGGNNTSDLINKSKELVGTELEALLAVNPYYSRPSQQGILRHYQLLADAYPKPIILYNVPARTSSNMEAQTTLKLAEHPNIIAMKEASGDLRQVETIIKNKPKEFLVLSGEDSLTLDIVNLGGQGVISVIGNILPAPFTDMVKKALNGDFKLASDLNTKLSKAYTLLSKEGNPSSLKAGLKVLGLCRDTVRPPLFEGSEELKTAWKDYFDSL